MWAAPLAPVQMTGGGGRNGGITKATINDDVGGERNTIGQASRTMAHRCLPRRLSRGSTIVRIVNGVNARGGGTGEEDTAEAIANRKS